MKNLLSIISVISILITSSACSSAKNIMKPKFALKQIKKIDHYIIESFFDDEIVFDKKNATLISQSYNKQGLLLKEKYISNAYRDALQSQTTYSYDTNNVLLKKEYLYAPDISQIANDDFYTLKANKYRYNNRGKILKENVSKKLGSKQGGFKFKKDSILYHYNTKNLLIEKDTITAKSKYYYKDNKIVDEKLYDKNGNLQNTISYVYDKKNRLTLKEKHSPETDDKTTWKFIYSENGALKTEVKTEQLKTYINLTRSDSIVYEYNDFGRITKKYLYHRMLDNTQNVKNTTINYYNDKEDLSKITVEEIFIYKDSEDKDIEQKTKKDISIEYIYDPHRNWLSKSTLIKEVSVSGIKRKRSLEKREIIYFSE